MRFLFVSRTTNRCGYYTLQYLLNDGRFTPEAVLLPEGEAAPLERDEKQLLAEKSRYLEEVEYYRCRKLRFMKSIGQLARANGILLVFLDDIRSDTAYRWLKSLHVDLIVLGGGWPQLISQRVIRLPRLGILNTHPSLLPQFRGTDVHRWQVYAGVRLSGVTIHYVDERFDTGDILEQKAIRISPDTTPQELFEKSARTAGPLMVQVLERVCAADPHRLAGKVQEKRDSSVLYHNRWPWQERDFLRLDWRKPAWELRNFVLACTQESYKYNGPFFSHRDQEYIVREAGVVSASPALPGEVINVNEQGVAVSCGDTENCLLLRQVQRASKGGWPNHPHSEPAVAAKTFAATVGLRPGDVLAFERGAEKGHET